MKRFVIGILAHVDAGKTTMSEAILYETGKLKKMGRVDNRDAFLDTFALERARGITIFSKQAVFPLGDASVTLLDNAGSCGLFGGDGADTAGAGLRGAHRQRGGWGAGTYGDALETFKTIPDPGVYLCE